MNEFKNSYCLNPAGFGRVSWYMMWACVVLVSCYARHVPETQPVKAKLVDSAFLHLPMHVLNSEKDLDALLDAIGGAEVVLLGEATHGTADFYTWRATISRTLITEKGFNAIAVEGDWADAEKINSFIYGNTSDSNGATAVLQQFDRWPVWLWANTNVASLITWLNHYNNGQADSAKISFTGTDLFSVSDALDEMKQHTRDSTLANHIENFRRCFQSFGHDERSYGKDTSCKSQAASLLSYVQNNSAGWPERFKLLQGAITVFDAEHYLRSVTSKQGGWNIREQHMAETILRILYNAPGSKIIVWQHNSHAGVASFSGMRNYNRTSVGEILKSKLGDSSVFITGFGTYSGMVTAARTWGGAAETMPLAPAEEGSWEQRLHSISNNNRYIVFKEAKSDTVLQKWMYMRSIGVISLPNQRSGVSLSLPAKRYDAFIFIDHTTALQPLQIKTKHITINGPVEENEEDR